MDLTRVKEVKDVPSGRQKEAGLFLRFLNLGATPRGVSTPQFDMDLGDERLTRTNQSCHYGPKDMTLSSFVRRPRVI
jgi:hypothetical protein